MGRFTLLILVALMAVPATQAFADCGAGPIRRYKAHQDNATHASETPAGTSVGASDEESVFVFNEARWDVGMGHESQNYGTTIPGTLNQARPRSVNDTSRSGMRLVIKVDEMGLDYTTSDGSTGKVTFIPFEYWFASGFGVGERFGRVPGYEGTPQSLRRMIGALVEVVHAPHDGEFFVRTKIASADYDRDKGTWDWRVIDVSGGFRTQILLNETDTLLELSAEGGVGAGSLEFIGLQGLRAALDGARVSATTPVIAPFMAMGATLYVGNRSETRLNVNAQERITFDRPYSGYLGRHTDGTTFQSVVSVDEQYRISEDCAPVRVQLYANGRYEVDTLNFSRLMFGTNANYESLMLTGGLRVRF